MAIFDSPFSVISVPFSTNIWLERQGEFGPGTSDFHIFHSEIIKHLKSLTRPPRSKLATLVS